MNVIKANYYLCNSKRKKKYEKIMKTIIPFGKEKIKHLNPFEVASIDGTTSAPVAVIADPTLHLMANSFG